MTKNINDVIDFANHKVEVEHGTLPQEKVVKGIASDENTKIKSPCRLTTTIPTPPSDFLQVFGNLVLEQKM